MNPAPASAAAKPQVHVVYMGGNDCPPCRAWRGVEFPKLAASDVFKRMRFTHVEKTIPSAVPPKAFLPADVKPYKEQLDLASAGVSGSAQMAILVNGQVFDYRGEAYSAAEIEARVLAIESGQPYPFPRCERLRARFNCLEPK